ncbi:MAG TPA: glycosyltransferase family 2 protein [Pyrinomonadaceae bacterium]|nr:glycosyltransferase family 2 protein [Pyrinomonadaceae bacterium]
MLDKITPLILTHNEAANIGRTLQELRWASDIVVVDSFSDDETVEILKHSSQVRLYQREFDSHAAQWNFGLKETGIASEWVLALDADYVLTDEFVKELKTLNPNGSTDGYQSSFRYCIDGRPLKSGIYPPVTVLYRRGAGVYEQDGHTHRVVIDGNIDRLQAPILHDDRKPLSRWFEAQIRYTKLEADKLLSSDPRSLSWKDRIRLWRVVAPVAVLFYCLILRGGILDGWPGWYYAFQRLLAESMLSLYLIDNDLKEKFGIRIADFEFEKRSTKPHELIPRNHTK